MPKTNNNNNNKPEIEIECISEAVRIYPTAKGWVELKKFLKEQMHCGDWVIERYVNVERDCLEYSTKNHFDFYAPHLIDYENNKDLLRRPCDVYDSPLLTYAKSKGMNLKQLHYSMMRSMAALVDSEYD